MLPLKERPKGDRVKGHVLEQVHVIAAAPKALRRYVAATNYGKTGVDVEFTSGIEIRFGDAGGAQKKWKAAAAVLADPSVTMLSYVDVHAPTRPTTRRRRARTAARILRRNAGSRPTLDHRVRLGETLKSRLRNLRCRTLLRV